MSELSRYNATESGRNEQRADRHKPTDIREVDQVDRHV